MPIKTGATVRQNITPIQGEVTERRFNESHGQMEYLVASPDAQGHVHTRWFLEQDIVPVDTPDASNAATAASASASATA